MADSDKAEVMRSNHSMPLAIRYTYDVATTMHYAATITMLYAASRITISISISISISMVYYITTLYYHEDRGILLL